MTQPIGSGRSRGAWSQTREGLQEPVTDVVAEMGLDRSAASRLKNRALGDIYRAVENYTATGPAT